MKFIKVSYSERLAVAHNMMARDLVRELGGFEIRSDANKLNGFHNTAGGQMLAVGVGGTLTGLGADIIIVDDPQNPLMANSTVKREASVAFFTNTLQSRLNDPRHGAIIIVMQRLHEKDLTGYVKEHGLGYEEIILPALEAHTKTYVFPKSGEKYKRKANEPLSARVGKKELSALKRSMGSAQFSGQYLQSPTPDGGSIFKEEWLNCRFDTLPDGVRLIQTWDLPFKDSKNSAKCAGLVMGIKGTNIYICDCVNEKMDFVKSISAIRTMSEKWKQAAAKVVEDKANGSALISIMRNELSGLVGFSPRGSKTERAISVTPYFEAGNVLFMDGADWLDDLLCDLMKFPYGAYCDSVDALVQGVLYLMKGSKGLTVEGLRVLGG
jgi:predicted phage terminase large subunit-like protein